MSTQASAARVAPLRYAVIGAGAFVFGMHRPALATVGGAVVGVCDINVAAGERVAAALGCPFYTDHHALLAATQPDVAVILTPHPLHAPIAIACLAAGAHVLVEKPMAASIAEADAMIAAARRARRLLAVVFQQRHRPEVRQARRLIQEGRLGALQRVYLVATWTRSAAYYRSSAWRATWAGEGGGVLMNQAPHNLDLIAHLVGPPCRLAAWTRTRLHHIETEDTVQAMLEWPSGVLGSLHISTAEAGQPDLLEIGGTAGYLRIRHGGVALQQFETDVREFIAYNPDFYSAPSEHPVRLRLERGAGDHAAVYRDLEAAIRHGAPLASDGAEGRMSLELANAMYYSSYTHQEVELPLDPARYAALLENLKAHRIEGEERTQTQ